MTSGIYQIIRLSPVRRACKWCAFVALAKRSGKCLPSELEWLSGKRDYSQAIAGH